MKIRGICIKTLLFISISFSPTSLFAQKSIKVDFELKNTITSDYNSSAKLVMFLPRDIENYQKIDSIKFSIPPVRTVRNEYNQYAEFYLPKILKTTHVIAIVYMHIFKYDYLIAKKNSKKIKEDTLPDLHLYLKDEKKIETNDSLIASVANSFEGKTEYDLVNQAFQYVASHLEYNKHLTINKGAHMALLTKNGDCTEYSELFVALCRARGIPARVISGYVTTAETNENPRHNWAEVYFKGAGWVPVDVLHNKNRSDFTKMDNKYIYISHDTNFAYSFFRWFDNPVQRKEEVIILPHD